MNETVRTANQTNPTDRTNQDEARRELRGFGEAYGYDVGYLESLLDGSPRGFEAFGGAQPLSSFRETLPLEAHFVARVATMQAEDCGACGQLNLKMAAEAGVARELLRTLIEAPEDLPRDLGDVRQHALDVAGGRDVDLERVERLRATYGDEGLAELALAITGSRIFPTLKRALGRMGACAPLHLDF